MKEKKAKKAKKAKQIKLPGFLKKNLKKDKFDKNILKRISKKSDIEFIKSLFAVNKEGLVVLKKDLDKKESKRLKKLIKEIKGSKGFLKVGQLGFAIVLVALTIVFSLFFKNPIIEGIAEKKLEEAFGAKCEISSLDLKILGTSLSFKSLVVADKDNEYKNLFELGNTNISLNTAQLFKAKFIAEDIVCADLQFNTDRKKSGALVKEKKKDKEETSSEEAAEKKESAFPGLEKLDADSVFEQNKDKLKSTAVIEDVNKNISEMNDKWSTNIEQGDKDIKKLSADVDKIKKINVKKIDLTKIQQTYKLIDGTISTSNSLYKKTAKASKDIKTDIKYATSQKKIIAGVIDKDYAYLKSIAKNEDGARSSLIADASDQLISNYLGSISGNALKAKEVLMKLKKSKKGEEKAKKQKVQRRAGRSVYFPTTDYPEFLIETFLFSTGTEETKNLFFVNVKNLTNDPDLINKPVDVIFKSIDGPRKIDVVGTIDVRETRKEDVNLAIALEGFTLKLNDLDSLNIEELNALYDLDSTFVMLGKDVSGNMDTILANTEITPGAKTDLLSKTIVDLIDGLEKITLDTKYEIKDGKMKLKTSSNADKELVSIAGKVARKNAKEYEEALKKKLYSSLEGSLGENNELVKKLEGMGNLSDANLKDINKYKDEAAKKRKDVEKSATAPVEDKIKDLGKNLKLPF